MLFQVIHQRDKLSAAAFESQVKQARNRILSAAGTAVPEAKEAQNMARRFEKHGAAYFQFITTPGMEPTNNLAEQAIRFVVIDRVITQGTRGEKPPSLISSTS
jgi:transposase